MTFAPPVPKRRKASQLYTINLDGSGFTQITDVDYTTTRRRPGEATWTPDGQRIIASIGVVDTGRVVDVKIAYIDPRPARSPKPPPRAPCRHCNRDAELPNLT